MSAALIWIALPILWGLLALLFRRMGALLFLLSAGLSLLLTWIAWQIPIDQALTLGSSTLKISPTLSILGRSFTLLDSDRPLIALVFLANTLWLLGGQFSRPGPLFIPVSQISIGLFVAALSVDPFLYAAILIATIVLISVPMLAQPGEALHAGLLRYLNFQLFAVPFILVVGWLLSGVEASPGNSQLVLRAGTLLALGFAFLLAIFPLHSWIPMLAERNHPYAVGFIFFFLPFAATMLALGFFERFAWLRDVEGLPAALLLFGGIVVALGGIWAAIQNHLGRQLAYVLVAESGLSLAALGLSSDVGLSSLIALIIARLFALLVWVMALSGLREASGGALAFSEVSRVVRRHPMLTLGLLLALLSFVGLPLGAAFAPRLTILQLVWQALPLAAGFILLGQLALLVALVRLLFALAVPAFSRAFRPSDRSLLGRVQDPLIPDTENPYAWAYLLIGGGLLLLLALFPQLLFGDLSSFAALFPQLAP